MVRDPGEIADRPTGTVTFLFTDIANDGRYEVMLRY